MKKTILTAMFVTTITTISTSQNTVNDVYSCVNPLFNSLTTCFESNDVTGRYSGGGNVLYFQSDAGIQFSQMDNCVINYNKDRITCPTAPLLVLGSSSKKKKTVL